MEKKKDKKRQEGCVAKTLGENENHKDGGIQDGGSQGGEK